MKTLYRVIVVLVFVLFIQVGIWIYSSKSNLGQLTTKLPAVIYTPNKPLSNTQIQDFIKEHALSTSIYRVYSGYNDL